MSKISIDGFQELFEAVRGMRAEFEGMVVSMRAAGGAATSLASQIRGPTQSANVPVNRGKGVYRPTANGNVMTFPNAAVDVDAMRQQVEEANAAQQAARGGTRFRRPGGVGGIDLSTMISGGDASTTVASGAARMQKYNQGLADTSKLIANLEKASSPDAKIIQQALQQSQGRIGDLQSRIAATKSGMYDSSGNAMLGDAELKRELKKLAALTEKQVKELEKSNKLEESARQLGFGGGGPGGPGGFMQGIADRFGGYGRAGMMGVAGLAHAAQTGFNAFGADYRNQSSLSLETARNIGEVSGSTFSRRMMANDTDPASLVRFYGDAMLGRGFASRARYVGLAGTRNANDEALRSGGLQSSAMNMDMGASLSGLLRNTAIGGAAGAIGGSIIPGLGTVAGGIVGAAGGLLSGVGGMLSSAPEFLRARGITLGGLLDGGVGSAERMRYATKRAADVNAQRSALEEADMGRFQDSVYGLGQIREAIEARKGATSSIGGMATDGLPMMSAVAAPRMLIDSGNTGGIVAEVGNRMRAAAARAAVARARGRMPTGMNEFGNVSAGVGQLGSGNGGREMPFAIPSEGPMQLSAFGRSLAENQMSYSMYAQSANMLSGALGRRAGAGETMDMVRLSRAGVGSQDQIAGNLMSLASTSNAAGVDNLKKIFGEAFAAGLKGSGFIQQFASLTQNLSSAMGVTNAGQVAGSLRGGIGLYRGLGDTAQVGMSAAAQGIQQFNNFSSMSGGVPGVTRAFGIALGGGTMANGGSSIFNMNAEQLGQTSRELSGPVDKMGSRTQMLYRNLLNRGMSDQQARETLRKQITGATEMTSIPLAGVFNQRMLGTGKTFESEVAKLKSLKPGSADFKNIISSIGLAGEGTEGLGREGALALVQNLLGSDSGAASKAISREIESGNAAFADPLNRKKFEFRNSLTEMTQAQRSSQITESEYRKFLGLGTSPVMARVNGQMRALTGDLLNTPEGKAALANVSRDDLVAATRNSMTEGITESAVYIKYLDPVAIRQFTDVFRSSGVDVSAPRTGQ